MMTITPTSVLSPVSLREQLDFIRHGYPLNRALRLIENIAPKDSSFRKRFLPQRRLRLLNRLGEAAVIRGPQAERIARVERAWFRVCRLYRADGQRARQFLLQPHLMLEGRAPMDLLIEGETATALLNYVMGTVEGGFAV